MKQINNNIRKDRGAAEYIAFIVIVPIMIFSLLFGVQVFLYYQTQSSVYSSLYMTLRAAEVYYSHDLVDSKNALETIILEPNIIGQGLNPDYTTMTIDYTQEEFFKMTITYDLPILFLADLWPGQTTLPIEASLLGRKHYVEIN